MKILVLSDSHGRVSNINLIFEKINAAISAVIHLGDGCNDLDFSKQKYKNLDFYGVAGNCDENSSYPKKSLLEIEGKKIFITHGHKYSVKSGYGRIAYAAEEACADICIFGHTHVPLNIRDKNLIILNPGSIQFPKEALLPSYAIIDIEKNSIAASVVELNGNNCKILL